jgi:hypothetical protein
MLMSQNTLGTMGLPAFLEAHIWTNHLPENNITPRYPMIFQPVT